MRVILLKDVGGVGQHGTVKEVKDGYALNFLIPQGLAVQATLEKMVAYEKQMVEQTKKSEMSKKELAEKLQKLNGTKVVIKAKANDNGHLFKKINKNDVANALAVIDPDMIVEFRDGIKDVGEYAIHLAGAGIEAVVNLAVESN